MPICHPASSRGGPTLKKDTGSGVTCTVPTNPPPPPSDVNESHKYFESNVI